MSVELKSGDEENSKWVAPVPDPEDTDGDVEEELLGEPKDSPKGEDVSSETQDKITHDQKAEGVRSELQDEEGLRLERARNETMAIETKRIIAKNKESAEAIRTGLNSILSRIDNVSQRAPYWRPLTALGEDILVIRGKLRAVEENADSLSGIARRFEDNEPSAKSMLESSLEDLRGQWRAIAGRFDEVEASARRLLRRTDEIMERDSDNEVYNTVRRLNNLKTEFEGIVKFNSVRAFGER